MVCIRLLSPVAKCTCGVQPATLFMWSGSARHLRFGTLTGHERDAIPHRRTGGNPFDAQLSTRGTL